MLATRQQPDARDLEQLRTNPANWAWYGAYRCALDPRLFVRDRIGLGWSLNEAHPRANRVKIGVLIFIVAMAIALGLFVRAT